MLTELSVPVVSSLTGAEYGATGRWQGRLTSRPLPLEDPLMEALSPLQRQELSRIWLYRAAMERRVADSFEVIGGALQRSRASASLVTLASRAVDDEYRHTEISRLVASRFAGNELPLPARLALELPKHRGASPALRDSLFIVGQCVFNETTACAFLEICVKHAQGELTKAALRELLSDEIDHGRLGWAYLATTGAAQRREISRWLLPMAFLNLRLWLEESRVDANYGDCFAQHGVPPANELREALVDALRSLILPGLNELKLHTAPLAAWLDAGAYTDRAPVDIATRHAATT